MLRDRFRKFWMTSVADAFKDDLEEIRKVRMNICLTSRHSLTVSPCSVPAPVYSGA